MRDRLDLLLGVAGAGGNDGAAERMRPGLHDEAARRKMIGKRVVHDLAAPEAGGEQRPRRPPAIFSLALELEDRAGRHQQPPDPPGRGEIEAAEWRARLLQCGELGLTQHRELGERRPRAHGIGVDADKVGGPAWRTQRQRDQARHAPEEVALALSGIARFQHIIMLVRHDTARSVRRLNGRRLPAKTASRLAGLPIG